MYTTNGNQQRQPFDWNNIAEDLGLKDDDVSRYQQRGEKIMRQAEKYGLKITEGSMTLAGNLADEYGLDRLLDAITCAVDVPKWSYVIGVLKKNRNNEVIKFSDRPAREPESKWFDPQADRSSVDEWGGIG